MCKWENQSEEVVKLFEKYYEEDEETNTSPSFIFCIRSEKMKEILLQIIEKFNGGISNHFTGEIYDKNSAKIYILYNE